MNPYTGEIMDLRPPDYILEAFNLLERQQRQRLVEQYEQERLTLLAEAEAQGFIPIPPGTPEEAEVLALLEKGQTRADLTGQGVLPDWARSQRNKKYQARARRKKTRGQHQRLRRRQKR